MRSFLVVAVLGVVSARLPAQTLPVLETGTRVRIFSAGERGYVDQRTEGTVERIAGDTLIVKEKIGGLRPIFVGHPETRLFIYAGRKSSAGKGLVIGGAAGIVGGGVLGLVAGKVCITQRALCLHRRQVALAGGVIAGLIGATTGLIIGALSTHEDWMPSANPGARAGGSASPPANLQLGISIPF